LLLHVGTKFLKNEISAINEASMFKSWITSCSPTNIVKALKGKQITDSKYKITHMISSFIDMPNDSTGKEFQTLYTISPIPKPILPDRSINNPHQT